MVNYIILSEYGTDRLLAIAWLLIVDPRWIIMSKKPFLLLA